MNFLKKHKLILLCLVALLGGINLKCQTTQVSAPRPDCVASFAFSAVTTSTTQPFNNVNTRCTYWVLNVERFNSGSALTVALQGAPSNSAGTAPGSYSNFPSGSVVLGTNPATAFPTSIGAIAFYPYVRMAVTAVTGTVDIRGVLNGWRMPPNIAGSGGGGSSNVTVLNNPLNTKDANICSDISFTDTQAFNFTASGNTQVLPVPAGSNYYVVCSISWAQSAASDVKLTTGTGTNCGTGTTDLSGTYRSILANSINRFTVSTGLALCINSSSAVNGGGLVVYQEILP